MFNMLSGKYVRRNLSEEKSSAFCSRLYLLTSYGGNEKTTAKPGRPQCEQETEQSLPVVAYWYHLFLPKRRTLSLHCGCTLWCRSLGVTFPLRFRLFPHSQAWRQHGEDTTPLPSTPWSYTERSPSGSALMKLRRQVYFLLLHIYIYLYYNVWFWLEIQTNRGQVRVLNAQFV